MIRTYLVPLLALAGLVFAVVKVVQAAKPPIPAPPVVEPAHAPYESFVAGSGLIEPSTRNIAFSTPVGGVVTAVPVLPGQDVRKGDVLFTIETRELAAELAVKQAALTVAQRQLAALQAKPRPEEVPPAHARLAAAQAALADQQAQLSMWENVQDKRAVSNDELSRKRFAVDAAQARVAEAESQLKLLTLGAWSVDVAVLEGQVESAKAAVDSVKVEIERRIVRAPIDAQVLQVNTRIGEYAQPGPLATPLMILGSVHPLHVRVDIDEYDAWRLTAGSPATAFLRGNNAIKADLKFVRFEPYVIPKRSLTGESTERVDTRVLQAIYSFEKGKLPVFVGQQMDVYIESAPIQNAQPAPAASPEPGAAK
ncbi:MAG: HlyD family efflux transporter periplasmic adaptor subunit [Phycisphaerae bacterium]|nr:HlyD family efflux transporter periplasmic adaptor subunit [Phycisphaerae bacterium]